MITFPTGLYSGFSPLDVTSASLVAWWDGSDGDTMYQSDGTTLVGSSGDVYYWHDKSGNDNHLATTDADSGGSPISTWAPEWNDSSNLMNGIPCIHFNVSWMTVDSPMTGRSSQQEMSYFNTQQLDNDIVSLGGRQLPTLIWTPTDVDEQSEGTFFLDDDSASACKFYRWSAAGDVDLVSTTLEDASPHMYTATREQDGSNYYNYEQRDNDTPVTVTTTRAIDSTPQRRGMRVGISYRDSTSSGFKGKFGEIILYDGKVSDADRNRVQAYLNDRWGCY